MKAAARAMGMEGDDELDQERGDRERLKNEESEDEEEGGDGEY